MKIKITKPLYGSSGKMTLDIDIEVEEGNFIAIAGESGAGKSTLLRVLAGLEEATGEIEISNRVWLSRDMVLATQKRNIGFVFQDYALFENMTIEDNLLFVTKDRELADHLLSITKLQELKDRFPNSLSGGQKQRVALCRALMNRPKLLLMDEPLSALDPTMRKKLQNEIAILHKEFKTTTIMVSHDPSEIYHLASRVIVLKNGKIVDDGTPKDILLKKEKTKNLSFEGEVLDIIKTDNKNIAIIAIGQQLIETVIDQYRIKNINIGDIVIVEAKEIILGG